MKIPIRNALRFSAYRLISFPNLSTFVQDVRTFALSLGTSKLVYTWSLAANEG